MQKREFIPGPGNVREWWARELAAKLAENEAEWEERRELLSLVHHLLVGLRELERLLRGLPPTPAFGEPKAQMTVKVRPSVDVWARSQREERAAAGFHAQVSNVGARAKRFLSVGVNPWSETGWTAEELDLVRQEGRVC